MVANHRLGPSRSQAALLSANRSAETWCSHPYRGRPAPGRCIDRFNDNDIDPASNIIPDVWPDIIRTSADLYAMTFRYLMSRLILFLNKNEPSASPIHENDPNIGRKSAGAWPVVTKNTSGTSHNPIRT